MTTIKIEITDKGLQELEKLVKELDELEKKTGNKLFWKNGEYGYIDKEGKKVVLKYTRI